MAEDTLLQASRLYLLTSGAEEGSKEKMKYQQAEEHDRVHFAAVLDQEDVFVIEDVTHIITEHNEAFFPKEQIKATQNRSDSLVSSSWVDKVKLSPKFGRKKFVSHSTDSVPDRPGIDAGNVSPKLFRKKFQQGHKDKVSKTSKLPSKPTNDFELAASSSGTREKSERVKQSMKGKALKKEGGSDDEMECKGRRTESLPLSSEGSPYVRCYSTPSRQDIPRIRLRRVSDPTAVTLFPSDTEDDCITENTTPRTKQSLLRRLSPRPLKNFKFLSFGNKCAPEQAADSLASTPKGFYTPQATRKMSLAVSNDRAGLYTRRSSAPNLAATDESAYVKCYKQLISCNKQDYNNNAVTLSALEKEDDEIRDIASKALRQNLRDMQEYNAVECDRRGKNISKVIMDNIHIRKAISAQLQYKLACGVYIGAVRDDGIRAAVCSLWCPAEDNLVVVDYHGNHLYAIATVIVTPLT